MIEVGTKSVGLGALGCGVKGFDVKQSAKYAAEAFHKHGVNKKSLQSVDLVLRTEAMRDVWRAVFKERLGEEARDYEWAIGGERE